MRPRTERSPTRRLGSPCSGASNDALTSIRLSLTVGRRSRTEPRSQDASGGGSAVVACANKSADTALARVIAVDARRKSRRLVELMLPPSCNLLHRAVLNVGVAPVLED